MEKEVRKKAKFGIKTIIGMLVTLVALVVVVVLIVMSNRQEPISDDSFVTDDTKVVAGMDVELCELAGTEYEPESIYNVYYTDGDKVTGITVYYRYRNDDEARAAVDQLENKSWYKSKRQNGKYIVVEFTEPMYKDMTLERAQELAG